MNYIEKCVDKLSIINDGDNFIFQEEQYFSLDRIKYLPDIINQFTDIEDIVITPYYFENNKRLELYDYELSIRIVDSIQDRNEFILKRTGKVNINDIHPDIIKKFDNTYFEVNSKKDKMKYIQYLKKYIDYMEENEDYLLKKLQFDTLKNKGDSGLFFQIF